MRTALEVFSDMAKSGNKALKMIPLSNVKRYSSGKNGWGELTIAFPNELINNLATDNLVGGLLICDRNEYEKENANGNED